MLGGQQPDKSDPAFVAWQKAHDKIISLGGLHVIGTERHEARRIDNQLRGRAGRQGDPGSSQFFVSMEDDLMRIFGGDRMRSIMQTLNVPEDMPIENRMVSKSIESAQTKVEGNNFDIRKHLVEYDDVINKHRESIYGKRREILMIYERLKKKNEDITISNDEFLISNKTPSPNVQTENEQKTERTLSEIILGYIENEIEQVVAFHTAADYSKDWNLGEIYQTVTTIFPVEAELKEDLSKYAVNDNHKLDKAGARTAIIEHLMKLAKEKYAQMADKLNRSGVDWPSIEKAVLIRAIDTLWIEHLEAVASVRQGIGLRGYGQRDPLVEYKREAFQLYSELVGLIQKEVVYSIYKLAAMENTPAARINGPSLADRATTYSAPAKEMSRGAQAFLRDQVPTAGQGSKGGTTVDLVRPKAKDEYGDKIGRNDPCPCGSGKKYKKCHGA
jgi:preprotein translocase subunit SecA